MINKPASEKMRIIHDTKRPMLTDYINELFTDFTELHGDRYFSDDHAILGGVGYFNGTPVTVIGHRKGRTIEQNMDANFGMAHPEGYRKALRLAHQAEKFHRPVINFVDTGGAFCGVGAEERGQGEAIARNLFEMSRLTVPVIAVVTGEGNSGGALALAVANRVLMLENAVYAILSPEGFASILWKDAHRAGEAAELMRLTAPELKKLGVIDGIVREPEGGAQTNHGEMLRSMDRVLLRELTPLLKESGTALAEQRCRKFRAMGRGKENV